MAQDKCMYKCTPIEGKSSIYIGLYVDNLVYHSKSDPPFCGTFTNLKLTGPKIWQISNLIAKIRLNLVGPILDMPNNQPMVALPFFSTRLGINDQIFLIVRSAVFAKGKNGISV